jgi:hypothetical protein
MLTDPRSRAKVVAHLRDTVLREFWQVEFTGHDPRLRAEIVAAVRNKVGPACATR